jgi:hypothetical protein
LSSLDHHESDAAPEVLATPPVQTRPTPGRAWWHPIARVWRGSPWLAPLAALAPFAAAAWWVRAHDPTDATADPTGPCVWHMVTGINGPGCGGTRMFYSLLQGDLVDAARYHLPALMAVPVLAYLWVRWTLERVFGLQLPALRLSRWMLIGYGVFFVVFSTVLRNLPIAPFTWFDIPNLADPMSQ